MKLRRRNTKNLLFVLVVLVLVLFSVFSYIQIKSLISSADEVNHSHIVTLKIEQAVSALKDAETAQRAFLVTGDSRFLVPFESSKDTVTKIFNVLQNLVSDNRKQTVNVKKYKALALTRFVYLENTKTYRSKPGYNVDTLKNYLFAGSLIMDSVRKQAQVAMQAEQELLVKRTKTNNRYNYFTPIALLVISIASLIVIFVLFYLMRRRYAVLQKTKEELIKANESLDKQNKFTQAIINSSVDVIGVLDTELRYIVLNERAYQLYPKPKEEIIGHHILDVFPQTKDSGMYESLKKALQGEMVQQVNYHSEIINRYFENFYIPIKNQEGVVEQVLAVGHDISEMVNANEQIKEANIILKRVNAELSNAKSFLQLMLDSSIDIITTLDENLRYTSVNKNAVASFKRSPGEIIGKSVFDLFPIRDTQLHKNLLRVLSGETVHEKTLPSISYPGKYFEVYFIPLRADNKISGILSLSRDVSDVVNAQTDIKKTNLLLSEAQRLAHIGSWEWDIAENKIIWSDELYRIYGVTKENFIMNYENYINCIHPEDRKLVNETVEKAYKEQCSYDFFHRIIRPGGEIRIIHGHGEIYADANGNAVKLSGTAQDVTEWKTAEEMLKKTTIALEEKNRELEKSNAELDSFSYSASHDLQEPLRKIQTFTQKIFEQENDNLSARVKDYFTRIQSAATRMRSLINALFSYSRLKTEELEYTKTNLNEITDEVIKNLYDVIEEKNAIIEVDQLPSIEIVPLQIQQLFSNLIDNSLKYSRKEVQPCINISAQFLKSYKPSADISAGDYWQIILKDNGIGFEREFNNKIFDLFSRLHGKTEYSGTGIGLAICKKVVENHNGFITASGEPDNGAIFNIFLPEIQVIRI